ncbi:MAG: hypothetical protein OXI81_04475 [Paracoccaceae bacterium]|nr:hypothetical protein [Paracoccaceae bacterium]
MKLATMPALRKARGQGAASWPFKYGPSSETSRHVSPVLADLTKASFWNPDSERTQVRIASPLRFSGASMVTSSAFLTLKNGGRPLVLMMSSPSFAMSVSPIDCRILRNAELPNRDARIH